MPKPQEIFSVEGIVLAQTAKAIKVEIDDEEMWLPRSQMFDLDELPESGPAKIKMSAWIAKEKGLR